MLKADLSNLILSRVNIDKVKDILGNTPFLNIFFKLGSQALIDNRYPSHIFVESTRVCNLKCKSCPRALAASKGGHMDFDLFKKIVDEASHYGSRNFCLHMLGEPLLCPKITDMVKYIKKTNNSNSILLTTNGYFLDVAKAEAFLKSNLDKITVSLFSLKNERNKILTGEDDIDKVIDNVKNMAGLRMKMNSKTKILIRFLVCKDNEDEVPRIRALVKGLGIVLEIRYTHNYSGVIEDSFTSKHICKARYPCYHLWYSPAITWDGKIVICCNDWNYHEVLGDVKQSSLADIWQGPRIRELRKYHLLGEYDKIPLCAKCNVWTLYPDIFFKAQKKILNSNKV